MHSAMMPVGRAVRQVETGQQDYQLETDRGKQQVVAVVQDKQSRTAVATTAGSRLVVLAGWDNLVAADIQPEDTHHKVGTLVDSADN